MKTFSKLSRMGSVDIGDSASHKDVKRLNEMSILPRFGIRSANCVIASTILMSALGTHAQVVYTDPVGAVRHDLPAGISIVAPPLLREAMFVGTVESVQDQIITLAVVPNLPDDPLYVHVLDGEALGRINTVTGWDGPDLQLEFGTNGLSIGDRIAIRKHMTVEALFDGHEVGMFSTIALYNADGTVVNLTYFGDPGWLDSNFQSAGDTIILPGEGFAFNASEPMEITFVGSVATHPTQFHLPMGKIAIVGSMNPAIGVDVNEHFGEQVPDYSTLSIYQNLSGQLQVQYGLTYFPTFGFLDMDFNPADGVFLNPADAAVFISSEITEIRLPSPYVQP